MFFMLHLEKKKYVNLRSQKNLFVKAKSNSALISCICKFFQFLSSSLTVAQKENYVQECKSNPLQMTRHDGPHSVSDFCVYAFILSSLPGQNFKKLT